MRSEFIALSNVLIFRGTVQLLLGAAAVAWPETALIPALLGVAFTATLTGLYEFTVGVNLRGLRGWALVLSDGLLAVLFGLLTAGVTGLRWPTPVAVVIGWLLLYTWLCFGAARTWHAIGPTEGLVACGLFNVGLAIVVNLYPYGTVFALLFFGALYAAALGAWHLAAGVWLRRWLGRREHSRTMMTATTGLRTRGGIQ